MNDLLKLKDWKSWDYWLPLAFFIFGIWYFSIRILGSGLEYIPGDLGDSRFINYLLEHGYQWMCGNTDSFWRASFMYPFEHNIAISDNMLGTLPIYTLWRTFGFEQETAYQLWWISLSALNYWSCYFVLKRWFGKRELAIAGAWIFAFTIFNMGQLNYMQMIIRFMVPVVIYCAAKWVETGKFKYFAVFGVGIVIQFYSVIYTGFFLMYFSLGFIFLYMLITKNYKFFLEIFSRQNIYKTLGVSLFCIGAMLWLMLPYLHIADILGTRTYDEVAKNIPTFEAYLFPHESTLLWNSWHEAFRPNVPNWWIQYTFAGIIPLLTLICFPLIWIINTVRKTKLDKITLGLGLSALCIAALYVRTDDFKTLYVLVFKLPGMNSIRVIPRFMHVELFFLIAVFISLVAKMPKSIAYGLILIAILDNSFVPDQIVRTEKREIQQRRTETIALVKANMNANQDAFAIVDTITPFYITQLDAMNASHYVGKPTVNGYSSSCPGEFGEFFSTATDKGLDRWLKHVNISKKKIAVVRR